MWTDAAPARVFSQVSTIHQQHRRGEKYNVPVAIESSDGYRGRGALVDRTTQRWVRATGRRVSLDECSWLRGPVGDVDVIGGALAAIFSRRLQQLNVPLSPLDTSRGISTSVVQLVDDAGAVKQTAWIREIVASRRTLYAGSYSLCRVPGFDGPCVKVAFPLPNGSANVIMRPESAPDGSFTVRSSGTRFGDPGFYFFVEAGSDKGWARYLKALKEDIRVYVDPRGQLRADHNLQIWGRTFLRLHYRMRRMDA
jgi:hypothetical protein